MFEFLQKFRSKTIQCVVGCAMIICVTLWVGSLVASEKVKNNGHIRCDRIGKISKNKVHYENGNIDIHYQLDEISGVAVTDEGNVWVHVDSFNEEKYSSHPRQICKLKRNDGPANPEWPIEKCVLVNAENTDWEDMAVGPCEKNGNNGSDCLYIADTGCNHPCERRNFEIIKIRLDELEKNENNNINSIGAITYRFQYPENTFYDVEALAVSPTGRVFVFTKMPPMISFEITLEKCADSKTTCVATEYIRYNFKNSVQEGREIQDSGLVTAADFDRRRNDLLIRTYDHVYRWQSFSDGDESGPGNKPSVLPDPDREKGWGRFHEALAYDPTKEDFIFMREAKQDRGFRESEEERHMIWSMKIR